MSHVAQLCKTHIRNLDALKDAIARLNAIVPNLNAELQENVSTIRFYAGQTRSGYSHIIKLPNRQGDIGVSFVPDGPNVEKGITKPVMVNGVVQNGYFELEGDSMYMRDLLHEDSPLTEFYNLEASRRHLESKGKKVRELIIGDKRALECVDAHEEFENYPLENSTLATTTVAAHQQKALA